MEEQSLDGLNPVEAATEQLTQEPVEEAPEVQAARFLTMGLPLFRTKQQELQEKNKTEVFRVLAALIESPLEQETHSFTTPEGSNLFNLGLMIMSSKHVLFNHALNDAETVEEVNKQMVKQGEEENGN